MIVNMYVCLKEQETADKNLKEDSIRLCGQGDWGKKKEKQEGSNASAHQKH